MLGNFSLKQIIVTVAARLCNVYRLNSFCIGGTVFTVLVNPFMLVAIGAFGYLN